MKLSVLCLIPLLLAGCVPAKSPATSPPGMPLDPELKPVPSDNDAITRASHETTVTIP